VLLSSIFVGTCTFILFGISITIITTLLWFSAYGFLDIIFRQRKTVLSEKCKVIESRCIYADLGGGVVNYYIKVIQETQYAGFPIKLFGSENNPPIGISKPLCPACKGNLLERSQIIFPFFKHIRLFCPICNKSYKSKYTISEIINHLAQIYNLKL
jgi:hypothetical protein